MKQPKVVHKESCTACGAKMEFIPGESYAAWRHPEAHDEDWVKAPVGAVLLPPLKLIGDVYQFECLSCHAIRQHVVAQEAHLDLRANRASE